jgi:hypothetical protein
MAIADKNILITPNISGILGNQPNVVFTGADSSIGDSAAITVTARPENTGTLSFTGSAGQLFSITNDLSGTIFSVNDVSGIPSLEIDDAGVIKMAEFNGRILLGGATDDSTSLLQLNGHMHLADNSEIRLGNDSDLLIYHTGSAANIINITGDLIIADTTGDVKIQGKYGEQSIIANNDGSVELYYDNTKKFETTDSGARVDGELYVKEADDAYLIVHADTNTTPTSQLRLMRGTDDTFGAGAYTDWRIENGYGSGGSSGGTLTIGSRANGSTTNYVDFYGAHTTFLTDVRFDSANAIMFDKSDQALEVNAATHSINLVDDAKIKFGTGGDLEIYHTGTHSFINDTGTGSLKIRTSKLEVKNASNNETQLTATQNEGIELYYNNTERFETTDSGVNVTGSLRVNNAELSTGASAGFAIAMAIAL